MSDWWKFDREPGAPALVEETAVPARFCQVCAEPISDDRQQQPLPFCDFHAQEREQVLTQLDQLDSSVFATLAEIRQLAARYPAYMPHAAKNTITHIEAAVQSVRQFVDAQSRKRTPRY